MNIFNRVNQRTARKPYLLSSIAMKNIVSLAIAPFFLVACGGGGSSSDGDALTKNLSALSPTSSFTSSPTSSFTSSFTSSPTSSFTSSFTSSSASHQAHETAVERTPAEIRLYRGYFDSISALQFSNRIDVYAGEAHYQANQGTSDIYGDQLRYPKVPLIHPYNPMDGYRVNDGVANIPLTVHFPVSVRRALPTNIQDLVSNIPDERLKIFLSTQNSPWADTQPLVFRPQYATEPNATIANYDRARTLNTTIFNVLTGNNIVDGSYAFSAHPNSVVNAGDIPNRTILSPNDPQIILTSLATQGAVLWSCVVEPGENGNAIVTLHWILSDAEANIASIAINSCALESGRELADLMDRLFNTSGLVSEQVRQNLRPIWDAMMAVRTDSATFQSVDLELL